MALRLSAQVCLEQSLPHLEDLAVCLDPQLIVLLPIHLVCGSLRYLQAEYTAEPRVVVEKLQVPCPTDEHAVWHLLHGVVARCTEVSGSASQAPRQSRVEANAAREVH